LQIADSGLREERQSEFAMSCAAQGLEHARDALARRTVSWSLAGAANIDKRYWCAHSDSNTVATRLRVAP